MPMLNSNERSSESLMYEFLELRKLMRVIEKRGSLAKQCDSYVAWEKASDAYRDILIKRNYQPFMNLFQG